MQWVPLAEEKRLKLLNSARKFDDIRNHELPESSNVADILDAICPPEETSITMTGLSELASLIAQKKLKSVQVLTAFARRACLAHQLCNCLSELFLDKAFKRAEELDEAIEKGLPPVGPIHGIPISFKDSYQIPGIPACIGLVGRINNHDHELESYRSSDIVQLVSRAGAVVFAKTAVPTAVCSCETNSNLIGYTMNAVNLKFSAGGSSGGEASLVAARGSVLGFATDVGGSVRQPASFQGLYGFKPSSSRLPKGGIYDGFAYNRLFPTSVGIFARNLQDIQDVCSILANSAAKITHELEPENHLGIWKSFEDLADTMVFGLFETGAPCNPTPPIKRCLKLVEEALQAKKYKCLSVTAPVNHTRVVEVANKLLGADGFQFLYDGVQSSGEPYLKTLGGIKSFKGHPEPINVCESRALCEEMFEIKRAWNILFETLGVDIIICATVERTAWTPDTFDSETSQPYTSFVNLLDYPAISIPVGVVDEAVDQQEESGEYDELNYANAKYEGSRKLHGMPVGVQLIGRHLCEEKVLKAAKLIQEALREYRQ